VREERCQDSIYQSFTEIVKMWTKMKNRSLVFQSMIPYWRMKMERMWPTSNT
jgi:hypothetical protein